MLNEIAHYLQQHLTSFPDDDTIIFNNQHYKINKNNFQTITPQNQELTFIDGGQAEILAAANFSLHFIRVAAITFPNKTHTLKEFFLLTTAQHQNNDLIYISKIFGDKLINESHLTISSNDPTIKTGTERAPISKIANIARRFSELALASQHNNVILDGTTEQTYKNEELYLQSKFSALAKSSSLFTTSGNNPTILLNKLGPEGCWQYQLNQKTSFVKLHKDSKHVFRYEGNSQLLPALQQNATDALFLGYPYGLILADKLARVSNAEKNNLKLKFCLNKQNKELLKYLSTSDSHDILDRLG